MARSTKEAWLQGSGDLEEADVEDVPVSGQSVRVRALPAAFANDAQSKATELKQVGLDQIVSVDKTKMEALQFSHGVVEPSFTFDEAMAIAQKYGPAFRKVVDKIDELSAIDKQAIEEANATFPARGEGQAGADVADRNGSGDDVPLVPARAGVGAGQDDPGDDNG